MTRRRVHLRWLAPVLLTALFPLTACDGSDAGGPGDRTASLSVFLTDAAGDVDSVWVDIEAVTLHPANGGESEVLGSSTGWILLTDLVGATQLLVAESDEEPGEYQEVRVRVANAALRSKDRILYMMEITDPPSSEDPQNIQRLQCPSCGQSGLKVKIPNGALELEEGENTLVLDFDVAQSFGHQAGNSGQWVMHPVIHATLVEQPEFTILAAVGPPEFVFPTCPPGNPEGPVELTDFVPTATLLGIEDGAGDPITRSGPWDEDEQIFNFGFLPQGTWAMGFVAEFDFTGYRLTLMADVDPGAVTLSEENPTAEVTYTLTEANCEEIILP
jgi:hypothetical protein